MERKPRIALMTYAMDNRPNKGTALYTRKLVERLVTNTEIEVYLVHYEKTSDPLYAQAHEVLIPSIRLPYGSRFVSQMLFYWRFRKQPFDILHWFQPRLYPFFWLAPAKKLVVTAHGAGDITAPSKFVFSKSVFNFLFVHFNKHLDAIIGVSEFAREEIIEWYKTAPSNTYAIALGGSEDFVKVDRESAKKIVALHGLTKPYMLDVSRHVPHKNIARLIEAYNLLRSEHDHTEQLVIVGSASLAYKENIAQRDRSPYRDDIIFIPYVSEEELPAFYAASELLAFPSLNEGFGLPVLEAFASGVPVVTSTVTSLPEVSGDAALLVDPYDTKALSDALHTLLTDTAVRTSCIERGRLRVEDFSWDQMAQKTVALYHKVLQNS